MYAIITSLVCVALILVIRKLCDIKFSDITKCVGVWLTVFLALLAIGFMVLGVQGGSPQALIKEIIKK